MNKKKILIIDDEVDLVDLVKMRLEVANYYVLPLYTSTRSLEIAKREKPDLVLLDVMMPDKNGYEVCKELKADEATRHIPVIIFTAKPEQKERIKKDAELAGADDYILKPFDPADLTKKIEKLLKKGV
ncbi:MAG: response regulator [Candidatus Omnitrophica bacterium]|nr:response regulator [Candidatus Omnitrophota bacterium]